MWLQILACFVALILTRVFWRRWKYDLHKIPSPPGLPLLGHTYDFFYGQPSYQLIQWINTAVKKLGNTKLLKVEVFGMSWLFVMDESFVKNTMMHKTAPFVKHIADGGLILPMIGNDPHAKCLGMAPVPSPYVKAVRRIYTTAFNSSNLKVAVPKLNGVMDRVIEIIEAKRKEGPFNCQDLFSRMILDAIGVVAFDSSLGGLDDCRDLYRLQKAVGSICRQRITNPSKRLYTYLFPNSEAGKKEKAHIDDLNAEWERLAQEILKKDAPEAGQEPLWYALRNLKDPETEKPIPYNTLLAEIAEVVLAGMTTAGQQLAWLFMLLASHPDVTKKLLKEFEEHGLYGKNAREVTFEDLGELEYLTAVIKEGMRIAYIGIMSFMRLVPKDMTICGYRVPKNTIIICPGTRAANNEAVWGDPDNFRPERWLTDEDMTNKYQLAFSTGPRDCAGQRFAMTEIRVGIVKLLTRYDFTLKGDWWEILQNSHEPLIIEAKDGIWLTATPRTYEA